MLSDFLAMVCLSLLVSPTGWHGRLAPVRLLLVCKRPGWHWLLPVSPGRFKHVISTHGVPAIVAR